MARKFSIAAMAMELMESLLVRKPATVMYPVERLTPPDRFRGNMKVGPPPPAGRLPLAAVQLNDPLQLVDADGPESLCAVRSLQAHAATVPPFEPVCTPP